MTNTSLKLFFKSYQASINGKDNQAIASFYGDEFMFARPQGVQPVTHDEFVMALPKRSQFLQAVGLKQTKLSSYQATALDGTYYLVKTTWNHIYQQPGKPQIEDSTAATYLVLEQQGQYKIVLQVDHQDLFTRVKKLGLD
jgi:hypothetical protein